MIDIEKCSLRPFKENFFAAFKGTMKIDHCVPDEWTQLFSNREIPFVDFTKTNRLCPERLEDSVIFEHLGLQFF